MSYRLVVRQHGCTWTYGTDGWKQVRDWNNGEEIQFASREEANIVAYRERAQKAADVQIEEVTTMTNRDERHEAVLARASKICDARGWTSETNQAEMDELWSRLEELYDQRGGLDDVADSEV